MNIRTTITLPEVVLQHIQDNLSEGESLKDFLERAAINQLEKQGDYEIRDLVEADKQWL